MATDAYLQIDGIKGESEDSQHQGWIECEALHWAVTQPKSATASTSGGHTAGRCEITNITFTKVADLASPILLQHCAMGKTLPKARFEVLRADGDGKPVKYYEIELENVLIAHVSPSIAGGGLMVESIGLAFSNVKWKYTKQKIGGGTAGNTAGGWNLVSNRPA
jgi:type VI secretion system secreted protein Hcp